MTQTLAKIEPIVTPCTAPNGATGWTEIFPDNNQFNIGVKRLVTDDRCANPLLGYNTEIWLLEGLDADLLKFITVNSSMITVLTSAEAEILAGEIMPAKSWTCVDCSGTGTISRSAWLSPILSP